MKVWRWILIGFAGLLALPVLGFLGIFFLGMLLTGEDHAPPEELFTRYTPPSKATHIKVLQGQWFQESIWGDGDGLFKLKIDEEDLQALLHSMDFYKYMNYDELPESDISLIVRHFPKFGLTREALKKMEVYWASPQVGAGANYSIFYDREHHIAYYYVFRY